MKGGQLRACIIFGRAQLKHRGRAEASFTRLFCTIRKTILGAKAAPGMRPMICLVQSSIIWPRASPGWVSLTPDISAGHKQLVAGQSCGTKHQHQEEGDETLTGSEMHWIGFKDRPAPEGQKSL